MATIPSPSSVVVSDTDTLEQNFIENASKVFCAASFSAGAYAIAGTLLGAPPLTIPAALLTSGALLTAMALCPAGGQQDPIVGKDSGVAGGQCDTIYTFHFQFSYYTQSNGGAQSTTNSQAGNVRGPASVLNNLKEGLQTTNVGNNVTVFNKFGVERGGADAGWGVVPGTLVLYFTRDDGLPDICGDQPPGGGQIITNTTNGDTINTTNIVDNSNTSYIIPVAFIFPNVSGTVNLNFGGIKIGSLFPLNYTMNIGGVRFGFERKPDGTTVTKPTNPDPEQPEDEKDTLKKILDIIEEINGTTHGIKDCVCMPSADLTNLFIPYVDADSGCGITTRSVLTPVGSITPDFQQTLFESATLANEKCIEDSVQNVEPELIFAATVASGSPEIFTGQIGTEVRSLKVLITAVNNPSLPILSLYPDANQRKFGSVSFVLNTVSGGGDYIYVFDTETYIPLPKRSLPGKLRILFKKGVSFEIYDTGERWIN